VSIDFNDQNQSTSIAQWLSDNASPLVEVRQKTENKDNTDAQTMNEPSLLTVVKNPKTKDMTASGLLRTILSRHSDQDNLGITIDSINVDAENIVLSGIRNTATKTEEELKSSLATKLAPYIGPLLALQLPAGTDATEAAGDYDKVAAYLSPRILLADVTPDNTVEGIFKNTRYDKISENQYGKQLFTSAVVHEVMRQTTGFAATSVRYKTKMEEGNLRMDAVDLCTDDYSQCVANDQWTKLPNMNKLRQDLLKANPLMRSDISSANMDNALYQDIKDIVLFKLISPCQLVEENVWRTNARLLPRAISDVWYRKTGIDTPYLRIAMEKRADGKQRFENLQLSSNTGQILADDYWGKMMKEVRNKYLQMEELLGGEVYEFVDEMKKAMTIDYAEDPIVKTLKDSRFSYGGNGFFDTAMDAFDNTLPWKRIHLRLEETNGKVHCAAIKLTKEDGNEMTDDEWSKAASMKKVKDVFLAKPELIEGDADQLRIDMLEALRQDYK
jgi:hypothetical protein